MICGHVHVGMSEAATLKRLINGFKTYKTFDLTHRANNIIGFGHCRRSASLCFERFIKMSKTSWFAFQLGSTGKPQQPQRLCHTLYIYFDLNAL